MKMKKTIKDFKKIKISKFSTSCRTNILNEVRQICKNENISLRQAIEFGLEKFINLIKGEKK